MGTPHPLIARLTAERVRRQIPVVALARRLGYTPAAVRNWETGQNTPSLDRLDDYAAALGYQVTLIRRERA